MSFLFCSSLFLHVTSKFLSSRLLISVPSVPYSSTKCLKFSFAHLCSHISSSTSKCLKFFFAHLFSLVSSFSLANVLISPLLISFPSFLHFTTKCLKFFFAHLFLHFRILLPSVSGSPKCLKFICCPSFPHSTTNLFISMLFLALKTPSVSFWWNQLRFVHNVLYIPSSFL